MQRQMMLLGVLVGFGCALFTTSLVAQDETAATQAQPDADKQAKDLLKHAREALKQGRVKEARDLAAGAAQLKAKYGTFDDRPDLVLADIARVEAGGAPSTVDAAGRPKTTPAADPTAPESADARKNVVIRLQHTRAADLAVFIREIFGSDSAIVEIEPASNSLLISADGSVFPKIATLVKRLDVATAADRESTTSPPAADAVSAGTSIRSFPVKHADAESISNVIMMLLTPRTFSIVPDSRTNSFLVRGSKEDFALFESVLRELDKEGKPKAPSFADPLANTTPTASAILLEELLRVNLELQSQTPTLGRDHPKIRDLQERIATIEKMLAQNSGLLSGRTEPHSGNSVSFVPVSAEAIRIRYKKQENVVRQMAQEVRTLSDKFGRQHPETQNGEASLRRGVVTAFDARQDLQRAELAALQQRLATIQQSIAAREKIKEEIINRRVMDLLNPNVQWETSPVAPTDPTVSALSLVDSTNPFASSDAAPKRIESTIKEAQVRFAEPVGARFDGRSFGGLTFPGRLNLPVGRQHSLTLVEVPGPHSGEQFTLTLDIAQATPETEAFLKHNAIPVKITSEDLDQCKSGNSVTKVIYWPRDPKDFTVETLVNTRLDPIVHPVQEAHRRGVVLATLQLAVYEPATPAPNRQRTETGRSDYGRPTSEQSAVTTSDVQSSLRAATDMRSRFLEAQASLAESEERLKQIMPNQPDTAPKLQDLSKTIQSARQQVAILREEREAQIQLLKLDLRDAESTLEAATEKRDYSERLHKKGFAPAQELTVHNHEVMRAQWRLERCKVLLDLYQKVDQPLPSLPDPKVEPAKRATETDTPKSDSGQLPRR